MLRLATLSATLLIAAPASADTLAFFHRDQPGERNPGRDANVYTYDTDTGEARRLTEHEADDWDPAWSPDGAQIAFSSRRAGTFDLWVMDACGNGETQLTSGPEDDRDPQWSPDGRWILFARESSPPARELWIMRSDGSEARPLLQGDPIYDAEWSPNGDRIAFTRHDPDGGPTVAVARVVRGRVRGGVRTLAAGREPAWSPDGRLLAFATPGYSDPDGQPSWVVGDVAVARPQGAPKVRRVTTQGGRAPAWTPDGERLVYSWPSPANPEDALLRRIDLDGTDDIALTPGLNWSGNGNPIDHAPAVAPGGHLVAFLNGSTEVTDDPALVGIDGGDPHLIPGFPRFIGDLTWRPAG